MMMSTTSADPRRAHPRRAASGLDLFCYRASASVVPQQRSNLGMELLDISAGGARVKVRELLGRGDAVTLELRDRNSGEAFRARGEVRWATQSNGTLLVGVQFREHYSPVELREYFATGVRPAADIILRPPEKRKAERFKVRDSVGTLMRQGTLAQQGLKRNLLRDLGDLSLSGLRATVVESLEPGALVQFTLSLATLPETLEVLGAVRWCKPDHATAGDSFICGVQFINPTEDRRKKIEFLRKWFSRPRR
jgi:Tfp pilus assembly protein PilZ